MPVTDGMHFTQSGHRESKNKQTSRTLRPLPHPTKVIIIPSPPGSVHMQIHQLLKKKKKSSNFVFGCCCQLSDLGVYLFLGLFKTRVAFPSFLFFSCHSLVGETGSFACSIPSHVLNLADYTPVGFFSMIFSLPYFLEMGGSVGFLVRIGVMRFELLIMPGST